MSLAKLNNPKLSEDTTIGSLSVGKPVIGKNSCRIFIDIEEYSDDYFNLALSALRVVSVKLNGGYYEPKSNRDAKLGNELYALVQKYKP